jgi:hypothetical protein
MYFCIRLTSSIGVLGRRSRMRGPGVSSARHHTGALLRRAIVCAAAYKVPPRAPPGSRSDRGILGRVVRSALVCEPLPMRPTWRYTLEAPVSPISPPPSAC